VAWWKRPPHGFCSVIVCKSQFKKGKSQATAYGHQRYRLLSFAKSSRAWVTAARFRRGTAVIRVSVLSITLLEDEPFGPIFCQIQDFQELSHQAREGAGEKEGL
jgi:hypothetical protein